MADLMAERYGAPSRGRRRVFVGILAVLVVAALGWLAWAAWFHGNPPIRAEVTSFDIRSDHQARALLVVRLADEDVTGTCLVRASAADHSIVGELNVRVQEHVEAESPWVDIRTERRATSVVVERCSAG